MDLGRRVEAADGPRMALRDVAVVHCDLDGRICVEQPECVGDRRASSSDTFRDLVLREAELICELPIGMGLLHRVEVGTLDVLDQRQLELAAIGEVPDDCRDPLQSGHLRRSEAALSGNELVAVEHLGHEDRLQDAVLPDARCEILYCLVGTAATRLVRVWADPGQRDFRGGRDVCGPLRNQCGDAAAKATVVPIRSCRHASTPTRGTSLGVAGWTGWSDSMPECWLPARGDDDGRVSAAARPSRARSSSASDRYASAPRESAR